MWKALISFKAVLQLLFINDTTTHQKYPPDEVNTEIEILSYIWGKTGAYFLLDKSATPVKTISRVYRKIKPEFQANFEDCEDPWWKRMSLWIFSSLDDEV